jgi:hypothetical protein
MIRYPLVSQLHTRVPAIFHSLIAREIGLPANNLFGGNHHGGCYERHVNPEVINRWLNSAPIQIENHDLHIAHGYGRAGACWIGPANRIPHRPAQLASLNGEKPGRTADALPRLGATTARRQSQALPPLA